MTASTLKMVTAGVDLSSQSAHTAACVIQWSDRRAVVSELSVGVDDDAIVTLVTRVDKLGIDIPLGWPIAFADAIAHHSLDGSWPADYRHVDSSAFHLRRTDLWVWKTLGSSRPLSVAADRIALPAMRAASLLSRLPARPPLDGSGVVVEVYPACALERWGLPSRKYKRKENSGNRRDLVERFRVETEAWLSIRAAYVDICILNDDAFDSLIAGLIARAVALHLVEPIPPEDRGVALREGWIAVPDKGSLGSLADPANLEM